MRLRRLVDLWNGHDDSRPRRVATHAKGLVFFIGSPSGGNRHGSPHEVKVCDGWHCKCYESLKKVGRPSWRSYQSVCQEVSDFQENDATFKPIFEPQCHFL